MKHLLYIPTGKCFIFYAIWTGSYVSDTESFCSIQDLFEYYGDISYEEIMRAVISRQLPYKLYELAEIPSNCLLTKDEFELIDI